AGPERLFDVGHERLIVRVDHQRDVRCRACLHDGHELAMLVNADARHVWVIAAGIDDHEDLHRGHACGRHARYLFEVRSRWVDVPVDDSLLSVELEHRLDPLQRDWRWVDIRHCNRSRNPTSRTGPGRTLDILLVNEARRTAVTVGVDHAWQDGETAGVDRRAGCWFGARGVYTGDLAVQDSYRRVCTGRGSDYLATTYDRV